VASWGLRAATGFAFPRIETATTCGGAALAATGAARLGEIVIDARGGSSTARRSTDVETVRARLASPDRPAPSAPRGPVIARSPLANTVWPEIPS